MTVEVVAVTGFQRCGSSMTMAMLAAGGFPILEGATPGGYEHPHLIPHRIGDVPDLAAGKAVKILEPIYYHDHFDGFPPASWAWIWLDRNPWQQAKSAITFMRIIAGVRFEPNARTTLADSYRRDRARSIDLLPGRKLILSFEDILHTPLTAALQIGAFINFDRFDTEAAAAVVADRAPNATGNLNHEISHARQQELRA